MTFFPNHVLLVVAVVLLVVTAVLVRRHASTPVGAGLAVPLVLAVTLVVIAARPMVGTTTVTTTSSGVDVVFMIDRTTSMAAEDHDDGRTRLEGVSDDVARIVESVYGSRFAVVVFDNEARVALPFTTDGAAVVSMADAVGWREATYGTGSDISVAVPVVEELLERSREDHPDLGRYVVYLGDGEQTVPGDPASFGSLAPLVDGGLVLGYGTDEGGPMREYPGSEDYVSFEGEPAVSVLDEDNLRRIAEQMGAQYGHRSTDSDLALEVSGQARVTSERREPRGFELYWIVAVAAVVVVAVGLWDGIGRLRRAREELR